MDLLPDLWRQEYWLPPGVTWKDLEQLPASERPDPKDLLIALPLALGFVAVRCVFERFLAPPIARCLGVKNKVQTSAAPSPTLESFYTHRSKQPTQSELVSLMALCGKTQRQIESWFRIRRNQDRPSQTKKFAEAAWRFFFYLSAFIAGLASLINRPWFWDHRECWRHYPIQPLERVHFWYYMLELGFYGSLLLRISVDVKRKDFREQVIHHLATIFLLSFSYCANYIRIGTLVMLLHDSSDILLESAKMFNYGTGWRKTCDSLFVVFAVVFLVTRLVIFPSRIIRTTLLLSMEFFEPFVGYYFFNALLMVLQALHIFWAGLILRMVYKFFKGKLEKDERSDEESEVDVEEEDRVKEEKMDQGGDCYWEKSKETLNSKLSVLTNSCVLNNLSYHRASVAKRTLKAQ
ncbi:PREDICTED: ceramide synthase 2-like [Cyprinodon variegatus]|uniref:Ceramide synthase 2-like n=1 Tax=Cyprinodon variegatus TaxID=28743 RepID=A0A3Q2GMA7_CYPVA|nr:PREDICTED: ceramide synthase 2-like [Cyprinodon variegatus]XP_015236365.1 PREDICTED: ceramide synthase 2-like [Cyprinodon variegatus]